MKGPMGTGLQVDKTGIHIAFTGGTGSLLFLDLVAHLVRKNLKMLNREEDKMLDSHSFKFIFFMSFQSRDESCGLELCEGLRDICKQYSLDNFELYVRLSNLKQDPRWDHDFINQTIEKYDKSGYAKADDLSETNWSPIRKIWVCGPPAMNEMFDRSLEVLGPKYRISRHSIDVL
jgi:NAD(P)H-flavin reductase